MNDKVYSLDLLAGRGGANYTEDIAPTLVRGDRTTYGVVYGIGQQGGKGQANFTEDVSPTLLSDSHGTPHAVAVLNDQGGNSINIGEDLSPTLRAQSHGHEPCVMAFSDKNSKDMNMNPDEKIVPTIRGTSVPSVMVFENHGQDTRFKETGEVSQTVSATFGMGGNNTPFVVEKR